MPLVKDVAPAGRIPTALCSVTSKEVGQEEPELPCAVLASFGELVDVTQPEDVELAVGLYRTQFVVPVPTGLPTLSMPTWSLTLALMTPVLKTMALLEDSLTRMMRTAAKRIADAKYAADL